jgi:UDP:flavonoid glycosyltransferase YjiC (YdhE family)
MGHEELLGLPLGRDQLANARRVEEVGLGRALSQETDEPTIRASVSEALASPELRARAAWMAEVTRGYGGGSRAVTALECVTSASE